MADDQIDKDSPWFSVSDLQAAGILLVEDGNHGEYRPRPDEFADGGPALFIRAADMDAGRVLFDTAKSIDDTALRRIRKGKGEPGDVLFSHKGTVGKVALAPEHCPDFVCSPQTTFWRTLDLNRLDRQFLHAFMRSPLFGNQWFQRKGETDMADYVSLTAQRQLKLPLPSIAWQRSIGVAVGAFDDLIENNRRRIELLEETARLLYREWFVHFRYPGHEGVPLVDSELGPIPEGWKVGLFGDHIELLYGKALKADSRKGGDVAVVGSSGVVGWHDESLVPGPGIVVGRKGNVGSVHWSEGDFYPIDTTYFVGTSLPLRFVYYALEQQEFVNSHAAVPGLSRDQAYVLRFLLPTEDLLEEFVALVEPLSSLGQKLVQSADVLTRARDLLLPRLVSGDLDISDLELDLEAVG